MKTVLPFDTASVKDVIQPAINFTTEGSYSGENGTGFTKNLSVQDVNVKVSEQLRSKVFHCTTKL